MIKTIAHRSSSVNKDRAQTLGIVNRSKNLRQSSPFFPKEITLAGFIQRHVMVKYIWCALFVTSQFEVFFMFPNQRFGEVSGYNMHIFVHPPLNFMCHCTEYKFNY